MKPLDKMTNTERGYMLAQLFPEELKKLTEFIKKEVDLFNQNKELVYAQWTDGIIYVGFWYRLIANLERSFSTNGARLYQNKRTFRDQLFDGYDALFTIHALICYTEREECSKELRYAINLLFGDEKLVGINLNTQP